MTEVRLLPCVLILLASCGELVIDGDDAETGADMSDDQTGSDQFETLTECDVDGRCWVRREWWPSWAQMIDKAGIAAGLEAETLEQVEDVGVSTCYGYGDPQGTVCVLLLDGVELHARPLPELEVVSDSACSGDGPWSSSFSSTFWCYGRFGQLGVALRDI